MSSRKIRKSDSDKRDDLDPTNDEFIAKTTSVFDWAYEHRRPLGLLIVVALIASVGGIVFSKVMEKRRAEESSLVSNGLEAAFAPLKSGTESMPGAEGDEESDDLTFDNAQARAEEALKRWSDLVEKGEPRFKSLGELEKAATLIDLGKYEDAVSSYEAFLKDGAKAPAWLKSQAMEGLGLALEAAGKVDDAKAQFEKWMNDSAGPTKTLAAYHTARLSQEKGDKEAAVKLYKEVMDTYKEGDAPGRYDVVFVQARTRLLSLDPSAEVPDMPAGDMGGLEGMDPRILQQLMQARTGAGAS